MSKKNILPVYQNIINGDMSGDITSAVTNIQWLDNVSIQLIFTGTPTGTFFIETSLNYAQDTLGNVTNVGTWDPITLSPSPTASGSAGSILLDLNQLSMPWIRVRYAFTSGVGTLQSYISAKEV